jgi:glycosyltransferase involved in cell wall biosynthesis
LSQHQDVTSGAARRTLLYVEGNVDGTIGGSYYSLLYLVEGLKGTSYSPSVIFHRDHPMLGQFGPVCDRVEVVRLRQPVRLLGPPGSFRRRHGTVRRPAAALQRVLNAGGFAATTLQFARVLREWHADLLHLNNSVATGHEWMLAALLTRTPYVIHQRGVTEPLRFPAVPLARRAAAVVCISRAVRNDLAARGVCANLRLIENGLDPSRFVPRRPGEEVRRELGIAGGRPIIGLVGNVREWKGQDVLVRALPAIVQKVPDVVCLFVGAATEQDREYVELLKRSIEAHGLQDHVRFTGYQQNVADYVNVMDVAVHASVLPEPFGRVALEAMALRKPVVCSREGGVAEVVEHGVTGYTVPPAEPGALVDPIVGLLQNPAEARALGEAGFVRLVKHFHISRNVKRTLELYDTIVGTVRDLNGSGSRPHPDAYDSVMTATESMAGRR